MKNSPERLSHPIAPVFNTDSKILILGSFPSVASRKQAFFYGYPRNRFWKVLSGVLCEPMPLSTDEKKEFLLKNHIAVWDVIACCEITGSSDSSIAAVVPNDLGVILKAADIKHIYLNGGTALKYYKKYSAKDISLPFTALPSTSPANAGCTCEQLLQAWSAVKEEI